MERKNYLTGAIFVFLCLMIGFAFHFVGRGEEVKDLRHLWKAAHVHGMGFAFLNIFYGLLIQNIKLKGKIIATGSVLAVVGCVVFPTSLFFAGFNREIAKLALGGTIPMAIAWVIMTYAIVSSKLSKRESRS